MKLTRFLMLLVCIPLLQAQSVRLPDWNCGYGTDGAVSLFFQPTEGLDLLDGDGAIFIQVEMPKGETKTQNGTYGFMRYLMGTDRSATSNNNFYLAFNPPGNYFVFKAQSTAGSLLLTGDTLAFDGGMIDETALLVIVQRSGDDFTLRAVSGKNGNVYGGAAVTLAGFEISAKTGDNGFAVGGASASVDDESFNRERGHNGNIEFTGYVASTITDGQAQQISLGADPVTVLGEANLRWYRHFACAEQETTLAATLSDDSSQPTVVRGSEHMVGGATIRGQAEGTYFMMDYIPDGRVWGLYSHDQTGKDVSLTGTHNGLAGGSSVQVRVLNAADMSVVTDWTDAVTVMGDSTWEATFSMDKSHGWDYVEARAYPDTDLVCRSRNRCGVGYKIGMMGQSETHYMLVGYGADMTFDGEAVSFVSHNSDNPLHNFSGSVSMVRTPQIYVAESWDKLSDGVLALARQLRQYTDAPVCVVNNSVAGTSCRALVDDDDDDRRWVDLVETVKLAGNDYTLMHWMWWVADNLGSAYGTQVYDPVVLGINNPGDYEHYLYDGTFAPGMGFGVAGFWGLALSKTALAGTLGVYNFSYLNQTIAGQCQWRDENVDGRAGVPDFPGASPAEFPVGWDIACDKLHWGHSDKSSNMGPRRQGYRAGEFVARILGFSDSENPKMLNAWFGTDHSEINVRFTLPNGGILRTAGDTAVAGLWISTDGGTNWVRNQHAAVIVDSGEGIVRMAKNDGSWPDSTLVAFGMNQIEIGDSMACLYEGPAAGTGTGVLAMEGGLGIPIQPYVPVPHAAAAVTVQASDPGGPVVRIVPPADDVPTVSSSSVVRYDIRGIRITPESAQPGVYLLFDGMKFSKEIIVK